MKIFLMSVLLLFEICTGMSLQKTQLHKSSPIYISENLTDVYEIEEGDKKTIRLVYPKSEKPTLREITFLHIKETPFSDSEDDIEGLESEDLEVVTRRSFTNGHGFQFLKEDAEKIYETKPTETGDAGKIAGDGVLDSAEDLLPIEEDEDYADALEELVKDSKAPEIAKADSHETTGVATVTSTEEPNTVFNAVGPVDEKINARNRLFIQARGKYQQRNQEKPARRHKREISLKVLPPAPTLAPLDLSILPEDVKKLITSTAKVGVSTPKQEELTQFNEDQFKERLGQKIEDMITLLSSKRDEDINRDDDDDDDNEDDDDDDDDDDNDDDNDGDDYDDNDKDDNKEGSLNYSDGIVPENIDKKNDQDAKVRKPRTFGMNLSNGRGYVWNDLLSEPGMPGMSFDVGEPEDNSANKEETKLPEHKKPETTEKPVIVEPATIEPIINVPHPTESKPIYLSGDNHDLDLKEDETKPNEESTNKKDLDDIEVSTHKSRLLPVEDNYLEKEEGNAEKRIINDLKGKSNTPSEKITEKKKEHNKTQNKKHENKTIKPENNDFFKELMKNEQFWKWLSEWTATYMELLMKHIKDVVEDEVASQMKTLAITLKKDLEKQASSHKLENIVNSVKDKKPDMPKENDKLFVDGKEVPITQTTNFDLGNEKKSLNNKPQEEHDKAYKKNININGSNRKGDKGRRKEHTSANNLHKDGNKERAPTSIRAQNIFGNVVGSDKVTNIFVFYPEDDKADDEIGNSIKPFINGANMSSFGSDDDKVDIDQRHPQITAQKDESTMTEKRPENVPMVPDIEKYKPTDAPNKHKEKSETKNKNELIHNEPTLTPKSEADKLENFTDKKEIDTTKPAKEDEPKPDILNVTKIELHKNSSKSNTETALDSKEKGDKNAADIKNAEEIKADVKKDDNKDVRATTDSTIGIIETTTTLPSEINVHEDKKTENKEIENKEKEVDNENENKETKELEKESNKQIEKESKKEDDSKKVESPIDSEKKEDTIILQA